MIWNRYREGRYPITPKQQARVAYIFLRHGYTKAPKYDRYELQTISRQWEKDFPLMGKVIPLNGNRPRCSPFNSQLSDRRLQRFTLEALDLWSLDTSRTFNFIRAR